MNDPFGSFDGFLGQFRGFLQNPMQFIMQRHLPQNALQDPRGAVQQLLNSGQMSQQQLAQIQHAANKITNNPFFQRMINGR
jgi:hypothetical protein